MDRFSRRRKALVVELERAASDQLIRRFFALGAVVLMLSVYLTITLGLTFFADEWNVILRPDWSLDSLFAPLNEHIVVGQVLVFKILLGLFGIDSTLPFRAANAVFLLTVVALTYSLVARRVGLFLGVLVAAVLVLLGPAWEDLLWPAGISFMGAIAGGLGAFIALERETRRADAIACGLLVVSLSFSTLGIAFAVGATVDVLLCRGKRLARSYIPALPFVVYLVWYLAYGSAAQGHASADNLLSMPPYVWNAASAVIASLTGLSGIGPGSLQSSAGNGHVLLAAVLVPVIWSIARDPTLLSRRLWVFLATALFFWASAAVNQIPGREPGASRYQLIGAVLVCLIGAELLRGRRLRGRWLALVGVLAAAAIVSNIGALGQGERYLRGRSDENKAMLAALAGARGVIPGDFDLHAAPETPFTAHAPAAYYFAALDRWGNPVADPTRALGGPAPARKAADRFLAAALGVRPVPVSGTNTSHLDACVELARDPATGALAGQLPIGGGILISDAAIGSLRLSRWSQASPSVDLGAPATATATLILIPADDYEQPWRVQVRTVRTAQLCAIGS